MASSSIKIIVGLVLGGIGLLLHVVGMATDAWSTVSVGKLSIEFGPFTSSGGSVDELDAVRAMTVIGALLSAIGVILGVVHKVFGLLQKEQIPMMLKASGGLLVAAFIFIIVGVIIWATNDVLHPDGYDLGYSFALSIVGGVLVLAAGIVILIFGKDEGSVGP